MRMREIERVSVRYFGGQPSVWTVYCKKGCVQTFEYIDMETGEILPLYGDELPAPIQRFCMEYSAEKDEIMTSIYHGECFVYER